MYKLLTMYNRNKTIDEVSAHCDIPCKIYDPSTAQLAVLTMLRMVDLLDELKSNTSLNYDQQSTFIRYVNEKETQGRKVKEEITIIWGDYIKQPQLNLHPELHDIVHKIMLSASYAKQHIDRDATLMLLTLINQFAELFWASKSISTYKAVCPYPPSELIVYPDLKP